MAFAEDLTVFFSLADFAIPAVFTRGATTVATCAVIFDDPTHEVGLYEQAAEELIPRATARAADVASVRRGDTVMINATAYRVERLTGDGTGVATIYLVKP